MTETTKSRGRPKGLPSTHVMIRMPDDLLAQIDAYAESLQAQIGLSDLTISRALAIRELCKKGLQSLAPVPQPQPQPAASPAPEAPALSVSAVDDNRDLDARDADEETTSQPQGTVCLWCGMHILTDDDEVLHREQCPAQRAAATPADSTKPTAKRPRTRKAAVV